MEIETVEFKSFDKPGAGTLSFFEATRDVPFEIKRIYYTYNVPEDAERGGHAHYELSQILFCPYGCIEVILDDGNERESVLLDRPNRGLIIRSFVWRELVWRKENSVLVVAASDYYKESDYIRNYETYLEVNDRYRRFMPSRERSRMAE